MTRTATWVRVLADVLGQDIRVSYDANVSAAGASLCAWTALGDYSSLAEAAGAVRDAVRTVESDPLASSEYQELYAGWTELSQRLQNFTV
jgi:xylulokinase